MHSKLYVQQAATTENCTVQSALPLPTWVVPAADDQGLGQLVVKRCLSQPSLQVHALAGRGLGGYCSTSLDTNLPR